MHTAYMIPRCRYDFDQFVLASHFQRKLGSEIPYLVFLATKPYQKGSTVKTLNIGTPRPATVVVLNMKPFNFTMK